MNLLMISLASAKHILRFARFDNAWITAIVGIGIVIVFGVGTSANHYRLLKRYDPANKTGYQKTLNRRNAVIILAMVVILGSIANDTVVEKTIGQSKTVVARYRAKRIKARYSRLPDNPKRYRFTTSITHDIHEHHLHHGYYKREYLQREYNYYGHKHYLHQHNLHPTPLRWWNYL